MKKKITAIFLCAAVVLLAGTGVAYKNTKTFGFDENAKVFSYDEEKFSFMDYDIYYESIENFIDKAKTVIPTENRLV